MFKKILALPLVALLVSLMAVNLANASPKERVGFTGKPGTSRPIDQLQSVATEEEAREVEEVVTTFMKRVQATRDFASAAELYLNDFIKRQTDEERDYIFPERMISSLPFGPPNSLYLPLWSQITREDWERLYFAHQNLMYLRVLYIVANNSPSDARQLRNEYPSEVVAPLKGNKILAEYKMIETLEDLRSVTGALEKAASLMRELFKKNPPEQTQLYKNAAGSYPVGQKQYPAGASVYVTPEVRYGFPRRTRFFILRTKPQFFEMTLVKVDEGMKIVWARVYPFN